MSKIIKLYSACIAVSATKSALTNPSGQTTFYFLPSLQRCLPLWVDLLKSWLKGGTERCRNQRRRAGEEKKRGRRGGQEGGVNLLTLFTLKAHTHTEALQAQTSDEAEHTHMPRKSAKHSCHLTYSFRTRSYLGQREITLIQSVKHLMYKILAGHRFILL